MGLTVDLSRLKRSIELIASVPKRYGPDVLNKTVEKIVIGSGGSQGLVHLTKKAMAARIRSDLNTMYGRITLLRHLAIIAVKRKGLERVNGRAFRTLVKAEERRIMAARIRSRGATVAGWMHALEKLRRAAGLRGSSSAGVPMLEQGSASRSYARNATANSLIAGLTNMVEDSAKISTPAIVQAAVDGAVRDNLVYLERKFGAGIRDAVNGGNAAPHIQ